MKRNSFLLKNIDGNILNRPYTKSMAFDGTSYINCGNIQEFEYNDARTYIGVFKTMNRNAYNTIYSKFTTYGIAIYVSTGRLVFWLKSSNGNVIKVGTHSYFDDGLWHLFVITYDGSNSANGIKIYIDGNEEIVTIYNNGDISNGILNNGDAYIGRYNNYYYVGDILYFAITDNVVSLSSIASLFPKQRNNGIDPTLLIELLSEIGNNLKYYWKLGDNATWDRIRYKIKDVITQQYAYTCGIDRNGVEYLDRYKKYVDNKRFYFNGIDQYFVSSPTTNLIPKVGAWMMVKARLINKQYSLSYHNAPIYWMQDDANRIYIDFRSNGKIWVMWMLDGVMNMIDTSIYFDLKTTYSIAIEIVSDNQISIYINGEKTGIYTHSNTFSATWNQNTKIYIAGVYYFGGFVNELYYFAKADINIYKEYCKSPSMFPIYYDLPSLLFGARLGEGAIWDGSGFKLPDISTNKIAITSSGIEHSNLRETVIEDAKKYAFINKYMGELSNPININDGDEWSISFYCKVDEKDSGEKIIIGYDNEDDKYARLSIREDSIILVNNKNEILEMDGVIPDDGDMHHIVLTVSDSRKIATFIDGIQKDVVAMTDTTFTFNRMFGDKNRNNLFYGAISKLLIFDFVLDSDEINYLYGSGFQNTGNYDGLGPYPSYAWRFDNDTTEEINGNDLVIDAQIDYYNIEKSFKVCDLPYLNGGMSYDYINDILFVLLYQDGDDGAKILKYDRNGNNIGEIDISSIVREPRDIAYDPSDNTFWVYGRALLTEPNRSIDIFHIDMNGNEITQPLRYSYFINPTIYWSSFEELPWFSNRKKIYIDIHPITGDIWLRLETQYGESTYKIYIYDKTNGMKKKDISLPSITSNPYDMKGEGLWIDRHKTTNDRTYIIIGSRLYDSDLDTYRTAFMEYSILNPLGNYVANYEKSYIMPNALKPYTDDTKNYYLTTNHPTKAICKGLVIAKDGKIYYNANNGKDGIANGNKVWITKMNEIRLYNKTKYLAFDGTEEIDFEPSAILQEFNGEDFSVSIWVRVPVDSNDNYDGIVSGINSVNGWEIMFYKINNNKYRLMFRCGDGNTSEFFTTPYVFPVDNQFHHIVFTVNFKNDTIKHYLDSVLKYTGTITIDSFSIGKAGFRIGAEYANHRQSIMDFAQMSIYAKELTDSDIKFLYNKGNIHTIPDPHLIDGLRVSFSIEEGSGVKIIDDDGQVEGTFNGGPEWRTI